MTASGVVDPEPRPKADPARPVAPDRSSGRQAVLTPGSTLAAQWARPDRRTLRWTVAGWAGTTGLALALLGPSRWRLGLVGEAVAYLAMGVALGSWRPLRRLGAALPARQRRLVPVLLVLLLLGQLAGGTRLAFPLVRFSMYSDEQASTEIVPTIEAVGLDGRRTVVTRPSLLPSWRSYRFSGLLDRMAGDGMAAGGGCGGFADLIRLVADLPEWDAAPLARIEVVATTYDLDHPGLRVEGVPPAVRRSVLCSLDVDTSGGEPARLAPSGP